MKTSILIVDDEMDALDLMEELFIKHGYETYTASNGVEALNLISEIEPDIVISDMVMPEMDGIKLLDMMSKKHPEIAVIMITAHGTIETAVETMKKGARDYILKPLRLDEILAKVETISQLKELRQGSPECLPSTLHFLAVSPASRITKGVVVTFKLLSFDGIKFIP